MSSKIETISTRIGLLLSLGALGSMLGFPELWQRIETDIAIEKKVHEIALEFPDKIAKKYRNDSLTFHKSIRSNRAQITFLKDENFKLKEQLKNINEHAKFNTVALTITSSALLEEMDKKVNSCGWSYYETNGGDNWAMFPCLYNSEILYSVDLRSDCRAYYTPINGSKQKVKF